MVPRRYIQEWKEFTRWTDNAQVEQDLVIERALSQIFSDGFLSTQLAFRGGTALHKLYLQPTVRYSEDIDLVQVKPEKIKNTISAIRQQLSFLGKPSIRQKKNNNTLIFRFESEIPPVIKLRLKIEINCREHFSVLGYTVLDHKIENGWFRANYKIISYEPEELLGTKLRALYQRKKGRDLFDIYYTLINIDLDIDKVLKCYNEYIAFSVATPPTKNQYIRNLEQKINDPDFTGDMQGLLRPAVYYNEHIAYKTIMKDIISKL